MDAAHEVSDPVVDPVPTDDLDTATLLSLAGSVADRAVIEELRGRGYEVTRAHGFIFQRLLTGPQTIGALASALQITQQGASKHVAELARLGLVSRQVSPVDARARLVALTGEGWEVIQTARRARAAFEERLRAIVGDEALALSRRVLAALLDDAGMSEQIAARRIPAEG